MRRRSIVPAIAGALWIVIGCTDTVERPGKDDIDCSAAGLSALIDEGLASVTLDADYDSGLLVDLWSGERANCESMAPDTAWRDGPWIKTREPCEDHQCVYFVETNYGSGFGVLKSGAMTLEDLHVRTSTRTDDGWNLAISCGQNDGAVSLRIPLRIYHDLDLVCIGEINVAVEGYYEFDSISISIGIVDGVVGEPVVRIDDVYVHVELSGVDAIDGLVSETVSWIASSVSDDLEDLFGAAAKARVETAYARFAQDCGHD